MLEVGDEWGCFAVIIKLTVVTCCRWGVFVFQVFVSYTGHQCCGMRTHSRAGGCNKDVQRLLWGKGTILQIFYILIFNWLDGSHSATEIPEK